MIYREQRLLRNIMEPLQKQGQTFGFVPTMGALHQGHLSLVTKALEENDRAVVSIFVNPTQFDKAKDLKKYPRNLEADAELLKTVADNILIYAPDPSDLYGKSVISKRYHFGGLEHQMEGKYREGHFDGVGTVLNLLFRAIQPSKAYFGEKDFQQLQVVRKLVAIEKLPLVIVGCPILREPHGLAMSSRNKRLSPALFKEAALIHQTLLQVQENFPELSIPKLRAFVQNAFESHPNLELEYFEIANIETLATAQRKRKETTYRAFIAVFAKEVRLIDNIALPQIS